MATTELMINANKYYNTGKLAVSLDIDIRDILIIPLYDIYYFYNTVYYLFILPTLYIVVSFSFLYLFVSRNHVKYLKYILLFTNPFFSSKATKVWSNIAGAMDFRSFKTIKSNVDPLLIPFPDLTRYQYSYELLGATGMRLAGV